MAFGLTGSVPGRLVIGSGRGLVAVHFVTLALHKHPKQAGSEPG